MAGTGVATGVARGAAGELSRPGCTLRLPLCGMSFSSSLSLSDAQAVSRAESRRAAGRSMRIIVRLA